MVFATVLLISETAPKGASVNAKGALARGLHKCRYSSWISQSYPVSMTTASMTESLQNKLRTRQYIYVGCVEVILSHTNCKHSAKSTSKAFILCINCPLNVKG